MTSKSINASRRSFLATTTALGLTATFPLIGCGQSARVVVVGGGFAGATAARQIKLLAPDIDVTLVEPNKTYRTCPFSNSYLAGLQPWETLAQGYGGLAKAGVGVVHDRAVGLDAKGRTLKLASGTSLPYDRLIVAPGIDFRWGKGITADIAETAIPHAWKAGPQTQLLHKQLRAMDDGGTVILCPPPNPFRCPPGPYERASLIATFLKREKPRSKLLILDPKAKFSKQALFKEGWAQHYGDMIEWLGPDDGGAPVEVDPKTRVVSTDFEDFQGDVVTFIPAQKAGALADSLDLRDEYFWCPVNLLTFESKRQPFVHVIGDAAELPGMPKSATVANTVAKGCAAVVVALLNDQKPAPPMTTNTCYSLVAPNHGITTTGVWEATETVFHPLSKGISPLDRPASHRQKEADYARSWYTNICADVWG